MTTIQEQLKEDMKIAMRQKNKEVLTTIRMIIDRIQKKEKETQQELTQDEVVQVLQTFKKQINEELQAFHKVGNTNQVNKLIEDLKTVEDYLPQQMTLDQVKAEIENIIANQNPTIDAVVYNKGSLMKIAMPVLKGKADNKTISDAVGEVIAEQNNGN